MATGTKTIILFLEKKKSSFLDIRKTIDDFFKNYKDVICGWIKNAFSTYVKNTYEDIEFNDYISLIKNSPNEKAQASEFCKEYKDLSNKDIIKLEKEKLLYFINSYTQQVVVADSGEKAIEKEFYGYEFSNRRGHEGIHIYKNEEGKLQSKLYNDDVLELENKEKLNNYILKNFNNYNNLERDIEDVQTSEEHQLKDHIHYIRLSQLMSFDLSLIHIWRCRRRLRCRSRWSPYH